LEAVEKCGFCAIAFLRSRDLNKFQEKFAMILNHQDLGRTIEVEAQSVVTLLLNENPTTGYRWEVETTGGLEMVGDNFERAGSAIGAGGMRVFQFRVSDAGSHRLSIKKWRDWEGKSSIIERFYATIVVK
jgi:inhibitor of cysteine peptidase